MKNQLSQLYETDFNLWLEQTVNHLKKGNLEALDLDNLIEEISDMVRNNRREIFSRLKVLLMHLLKWQYQPEKRTNSWINTIDEQREQLELIFRDSPSLKPQNVIKKQCEGR
jgi:secreted Zn-dependent insulinase-like peptidase